MHDEYISRAALLEHLDRCKQSEDATTLTAAVITALQCFVQRQPTADVAEVVQGQWEGEGDGYADGEIVLDVWYCSQCGYCIDDGTDNPDCLPKHCPGCGAMMEGGYER